MRLISPADVTNWGWLTVPLWAVTSGYRWLGSSHNRQWPCWLLSHPTTATSVGGWKPAVFV